MPELLPVRIQLATISDLEEIYKCDPLTDGDHHRREVIRNALESGNSYVASNGKIIGFAVLEYTFFDCGFVSLLVVHQEFRRGGVGTQLIDHLENICRTEKIFTSTNESNLPMQALLAKLLYLPSGIIYGLDNCDPELLFRKQLEKKPENERNSS
jgi:GNAT superfamily N-acetyltransferase